MDLSVLAQRRCKRFSAQNSAKAAQSTAFNANERPADFARAAPSLPSSAANNSMDLLLFVQSEPEAELKGLNACEVFLEEIQEDPIERMREQILEELGLNEDGWGQMAPQHGRAVEAQFSAMMEEKRR